MMAGNGDDTDRLYELPLDDFTSARDSLAKELRSSGKRESADAVKRLRKPSVAAWALNRVRREHPQEAEALLAAGRRLRASQERLLSGGDRQAFQEAVAEERRLVGELSDLAARELSAAGRSPSAAVGEKLRSTLHAVAVDAEAREAFEAGRLVSDHEPSGLGLLPGGSAPGRTRKALSRSRAAARSKTAPQASARKDPSAAAKERRAQEKALALHEKRVRRLEERIDKALARARERGREATEAEAARREARDAATRAAAMLDRAKAAAERARDRAAEADEYMEGLEQELRELREAAR